MKLPTEYQSPWCDNNCHSEGNEGWALGEPEPILAQGLGGHLVQCEPEPHDMPQSQS